mgnify:CR=1 FL=1
MPLLLLFLLLAPVSASANDLGELSANPYQQNSTANPFGAGSPFAPNGINNPFSPYGSPFSNQSATNPFATDAPRVVAVLDWELSTLGDPLADFTYVAMAWVTENGGRSGVMDLDRKALGIPELDHAVERYCAATGRDSVPDMNWYFAYNLFRLAGILQGIKKRVIDGTASSAHARDMSERVKPLAERAWSFAQAAGAQ